MLGEELFTRTEIWDHLQGEIVSDRDLDTLVFLLEESGEPEMAEEISLGIHHPTLADDLARSEVWHSNNRVNQATHQEPRPKGGHNESL